MAVAAGEIALDAVALWAVPRARLRAGGVLLGAGLQGFLHVVGFQFFVQKAFGLGELGAFSWVALIGFALALVAGVAAVRRAVPQVVEDESRRASPAAGAALEQLVKRPGSPVPRLRLLAVRARRFQTPLALAAVGLVLLAYFWPGDSQWTDMRLAWLGWDNDSWFYWSPVEAFGIAGLIAADALAGRRRSAWRGAPSEGFRLAVGVLMFVTGIALWRAWWTDEGTDGVTLLAAVALVGSALLGVLTRRADEIRGNDLTVVATGVAAVLVVGSLLGSAPFADTAGEAYLPFVAGVTLAVLCALALVRLPRFRVLVGGVLVGLGLQLGLHWVGIALFYRHNSCFCEVQSAATAGLAGAALLTAAGARLVRLARREATARGESPEAPPAETV
jgi:hypothetical protein